MGLAAILARVQAGYARVARKLGVIAQQYRPVNVMMPMASAYAAPVMVFDVDPNLSMVRPVVWGNFVVYAIADRADFAVGDILVCGGRTYFVCSAEPMRPLECVLCNSVVSIYGVTGTQTQVAAGCPAAIMLHAKGEPSGSGVPGTSRPGQFLLYMPSLPGVQISPYMTVETASGATYSVNAVEQSGFGVRATMSMQQV